MRMCKVLDREVVEEKGGVVFIYLFSLPSYLTYFVRERHAFIISLLVLCLVLVCCVNRSHISKIKLLI